MSYNQAAADPLNHNKLLHAEIERLRALLESNAETALLALTDKQRIKVFDNFCRFCGTDDLPCQCWNDE